MKKQKNEDTFLSEEELSQLKGSGVNNKNSAYGCKCDNAPKLAGSLNKNSVANCVCTCTPGVIGPPITNFGFGFCSITSW